MTGMTEPEILTGLVEKCRSDLGLDRTPTEKEFYTWWGITPAFCLKEGLPIPEAFRA